MRVPWDVLTAFCDPLVALTPSEAVELIPECRREHVRALVSVGILRAVGDAGGEMVYQFAGLPRAVGAAD